VVCHALNRAALAVIVKPHQLAIVPNVLLEEGVESAVSVWGVDFLLPFCLADVVARAVSAVLGEGARRVTAALVAAFALGVIDAVRGHCYIRRSFVSTRRPERGSTASRRPSSVTTPTSTSRECRSRGRRGCFACHRFE